MKRSKLFIVVAIFAFLLFVTTGCADDSGAGVHTHKYGEWTFVVEPTETTAGVAARKCDCDHVDKVEVPTLTDTKVWACVVVDPTCTVDGSKTYTSKYGKVVVTLEKTGHSYGEWTFVVEPTETTAGTIAKVCPKCNDRQEVEVAALTDASVWSVTEVLSTCQKAGSRTYVSEYGTVVVELAKLEHVYGEWTLVTEPTETATGSATRTCKYGETDTVTVPALTDASVWTVTEVLPTCQKAGSRTYVSEYGTVVVELAKLEHVYGEWTLVTEPTETATGSATRTCKYGETDTVTVPALTDASVWSVKSLTLSYNEKGEKVYTSVYGEVSVEVAKLVAPYDNKTYSSVLFDARGTDNQTFKYGITTVETAWANAIISLNGNGEGEGTAYPFRGQIKIIMEDEKTGKVRFVQTPYKTITTGGSEDPYDPYDPYDPGYGTVTTEVVLDHENAETFVAYVDFASGLLVRANDGLFNRLLFCTPFEVNASASAFSTSCWNDAIAIQYTYNETVYSVFYYKGVVYFGVSFVDAEGNALSAEECYNAVYVCVKDASGNVIEKFGYNGTELVVLDGNEGTYTNAEETIVVSGFGTVTLNGVSGTYTVLSDNKLGVYVSEAYYEVQLNKETATYTSVKPMVTINFITGEYATLDPATVSANINVKYVLPTLTNDLYKFKGWYYDEACTKAVGSEFVPTENVTLYALWKAKVVINLVGVADGDASTLYLGEGDKIGDFLPKYGLDLANRRIFKGWYLDSEFENTLPEEAAVTVDDTDITIYAKWDELPAYYGTYYGTEAYNAGYGNYGGKKLIIDENGNISGQVTGIVVSYDKATQKIEWKTSATATTKDAFYFDEETGVIAGIYSKGEIGNDYYIFSTETPSDGKIVANFGVKAPKYPGSSTTGYFAQFVTINTKLGVKTLFLYNNHIYNNVSVATSTGEEFTNIKDIKNAKTVVVKELTTSEVLIALSAVNDTFGTGSNTKLLDEYYGTYTNGSETIELDGCGVIKYGSKTGTYTKVTSGEYGFDVYLENNTEYYRLTLDTENNTFVLVMPKATISFVVGEGHTEIASISCNINVPVKLPSGEDAGYVFNGWFYDQEFTKAVPANLVITEDITLYAKYSNPAKLTIVYNDGVTENTEIIYSVGDIAKVEKPKYAKHRFIGWYTTEECAAGSEWTSGTQINADTIIYAKWEIAPIYNAIYVPVEFTKTEKNGGVDGGYARISCILDIDPDGMTTGKGYPYNGSYVVKNYDAEKGTLDFCSSNGSTVYHGFIDPVTTIIFVNTNSGDVDFNAMNMFIPIEGKYNYSEHTYSSSYWDGGSTKAIQYTTKGNTYSYFLYKNHVYMNVSFKDAEGNDIEGKDCYTASSLTVLAADNTVIAKFGYDGTTMQSLDGFEGTYTNGENSLTLDGIKTITMGEYTGTYTKAKEGSSYTFDVYMTEGTKQVYYQLTVSKEAGTYTIAKPEVTISFNAGEYATVGDVVANINVALELPVPHNAEYVFRGWYLDSELTKKVSGEYVPTENATLYAKWDKKATLTVIYGNGMEDATLEYGVGDTINPVKPGFTNGKVFSGWYLDAECTEKLTATTITENMTIYCKWAEGVPTYGSYRGWNMYGNDAKANKKPTVDMVISVDGIASGRKEGKVTGTTGVIKIDDYYAYYEETLGIIYMAYGSNTSSCGTDTFVFVKGGYTVSHESANLRIGGSDSFSKVVTLELSDGTIHTVLFAENKVYADVIVKDANGDLYTKNMSNVTSSTSVTIYASDGTTVLYSK